MKLKLLLTLSFFLGWGALQAQTALPDSPQESQESLIYTISRDNLRKIHLKEKPVNEQMLGRLVMRFPQNEGIPQLKRGNYIRVKAVRNKLVFNDLVVDRLRFKLVPGERIRLCLYDSLGRVIPDAVVKCGSKSLKYDSATQTYWGGKLKKEETLEVAYQGVYHYIDLEKQLRYPYLSEQTFFSSAWQKIKGAWFSLKRGVQALFHPSRRPEVNPYKGFVVFSKPKYKPGETVKIKGYMAQQNGKPYENPVNIRLSSYYPERIDTVLVANLKPYRPGMYTTEFKLSDSLNLKLDVNYTVSLEELNQDRKAGIDGSFRYEAYELKGLRFSMTTNKNRVTLPGDSVNVTLKVRDENNMAVYGGRAELYVIPRRLGEQRPSGFVFMPDTLWSHQVEMAEVAEKTVTLPDSIFPQGLSFAYRIEAVYLSADNEKQTENSLLVREAKRHRLDFSLSKGRLAVTQHSAGATERVKAQLTIEGEEGEKLSVESVELPYTFSVPWFASSVTVKTKDVEETYELMNNQREDQLGYQFYRQNDSIFFHVDNPAEIPFWYTIRQGKKQVTSGYAKELRYAASAHREQGYSMMLSYLFGGKAKKIEQALPYVDKNLSLDVSTPTAVYPGQTTDVTVSVTDRNGKPVGDVDVTAYGFTSKSTNYAMPFIDIPGRFNQAKPFVVEDYNSDESRLVNQERRLTWGLWRETMALDTLEYYRFLYPEDSYTYAEPTADGATLLLPYVVVDGALQRVHMFWIDGCLYYTSLAQQTDVYAFQVKPGEHRLKLRLADRELVADPVLVKKGQRTIVSFNGGTASSGKLVSRKDSLSIAFTSRLLPKKARGVLSDLEEKELTNQLIVVDQSFGQLSLPNVYATYNLPTYLKAGHTYYDLNQTLNRTYNRSLRTNLYAPVVVGPFPTRTEMGGWPNMAALYADKNWVGNLEIEGGRRYTFYGNYQKVSPWENRFLDKSLKSEEPTANFRQSVLTPQTINDQFDRLIKANLTTLVGSALLGDTDQRSKDKAHLSLSLGKDKKGVALTPILILVHSKEENDTVGGRLYYGGTRYFRGLPEGAAEISLVFADSTAYTQSVSLRLRGENYLTVDSLACVGGHETAQKAFDLFSRQIKKSYPEHPYAHESRGQDSVIYVKGDSYNYSFDNAKQGVVTGVVTNQEGEPYVGATVTVKGTNIGTLTGFDGSFRLKYKKGHKLVFAYIGCRTKEVRLNEGTHYRIILEDSSGLLEEVSVVGLGSAKQKLAAPATRMNFLPGKVSGVMVRGVNSADEGAQPLVLVDGVPYNGSLDDLDPALVLSVNVLKDASATAIYGERAANGVMMVQTKNLKKTLNEEAEAGAGRAIRCNFHDAAFWQPQLRTNSEGKASFEVTYPDDITAWNTYFIAIGDKKQADTKQLTVNSFKALTARLSVPAFAIRGDSLRVVGRLANHFGDSVSVERQVKVAHRLQSEQIKLGTSHVDYIPVQIGRGDSLSIRYALEMANGYFDGEERSIPILEQGLLQSLGHFKVLDDSLTHQMEVNPALGKVLIYAETTLLESLERELDKVIDYPYSCNEQMGSKIKALLSKRALAAARHQTFKGERQLKKLIGRLGKNKNSEGLWGWWNRSQTDFWVSKQVLSALLDAEEAGYATDLNKEQVSAALEQELKTTLEALKRMPKTQLPWGKSMLLDELMLLKRLGASIDYVGYLKTIDGQLKNHSVADQLKVWNASLMMDPEQHLTESSMTKESKRTLLGSMYWGDRENDVNLFRIAVLPSDNSIENTLMAYEMLKKLGGREELLKSIRHYFFECRHQGRWRNTYESSRIIETLLPDLLKGGESLDQLSLTVNGHRVTQFPYVDSLVTSRPVELKKTGALPLYVTTYQQAWNEKPLRELGKGFSVTSSFTADGDTLSHLKAGKRTALEVLVHVSEAANYVQVEIPIPAGCSYDTKSRGYLSGEVHREYFKEKVVIFCRQLEKGDHRFVVNLLPRYTGVYHLNPAKVELMYFPTFYGHEGMKRLRIE